MSPPGSIPTRQVAGEESQPEVPCPASPHNDDAESRAFNLLMDVWPYPAAKSAAICRDACRLMKQLAVGAENTVR